MDSMDVSLQGGSPAATSQWLAKIHTVQTRRSPEAVQEAQKRAESSRRMEQAYRKCKSVKGHAVRSRALAAEAMCQMSTSVGVQQLDVEQNWRSATLASKTRSKAAYERASAVAVSPAGPSAAAEVIDSDEEEEEAMDEVAGLMNAPDRGALAMYAEEALAVAAPGPPGAPGHRASRTAGSKVQELMEQLRVEPTDEAECSAKFQLYDGYSNEVMEMRSMLFQFCEESRSTLPEAVAADMDRNLARIDSKEAMGVPVDVREWIVYHMMKQAEKNNLGMAGTLDQFEKKLQFLSSNDQTECPVCLEPFSADGDHVAQTLGCCHKVCRDCWGHWKETMGARAFCPLCMHSQFLGEVTMRVSQQP